MKTFLVFLIIRSGKVPKRKTNPQKSLVPLQRLEIIKEFVSTTLWSQRRQLRRRRGVSMALTLSVKKEG